MKRKPAKAAYTPAIMITIQMIDTKIPFNLSTLYPNDLDYLSCARDNGRQDLSIIAGLSMS